jgi:uncharacterized protein YjbI with pentapeptide repeats
MQVRFVQALFGSIKRKLFYTLLIFAVTAAGQVAGTNVNMVSGTTWPDGDPFLQRQNSPSIAASTRNPQHLLAGANDYRSVDLPSVAGAVAVGNNDPTTQNKDAWLGIFKSSNGGATWQSTLLPGCPYIDNACNGVDVNYGQPIAGFKYSAASDPVVRAGTNGMFYYSGIAFLRDETAGSIFVARFIDNNNSEATNPIQYIDTKIVVSGTPQGFVDKPWVAVDIPRAGALSCTVNGQTFPGGNVYVAYATFPVPNNSLASISFTRSRDCGVTWSQPIQLVDNTYGNQGATFAIDPVTGYVYLAWRQYRASAGFIYLAKSTDGGATFSTPVQVAALTAFDQVTGPNSFRTSSYPSVTTDATGRVYAAWSDRVGPSCGSEGCARIVVSSSADGITWTTPQIADPAPDPGHQWMPSLTFSGGLLSLLYYDSRDDHKAGTLICGQSPCSNISQYMEQLNFTNDDSLAAVFTPGIVDDPTLARRHTVDVRITQAPPGALLSFSYPSVQVTQYLFGSPTTKDANGDPLVVVKPINQLRYDTPDLPMFEGGTAAYLGDYIDLTPIPAFVPIVIGTRSVWRYNNTSASTGSVLQAVWTDNRDVIPPPDQDWTKYTPPQTNPTQSIIDPSQSTPVCLSPGSYTGTRNQNIYTARIASGVVAGSPGNNKTLSTSFERGFVIFVENTSTASKTYLLSIPSSQQPPGGYASFVSKVTQSALVSQLYITIPPKSSISRTVFVISSNPHASIAVSVNEVSGILSLPVSGPGTQATILINPDLTNPDLTNTSLTSGDAYDPSLTNIGQANPDLTNPDLTNPDLTNPDLTNPDLTNPDLTNRATPNPDLTNPDLTNPDLTNPDLTNPDLTNPDLTNRAVSDTVFELTNNGNAAASYNVQLVLKGQIPPGVQLQLLLYRVYKVPVAVGCNLTVSAQNQLIANILNPKFSLPADLTNPNLTNGADNNATLFLAPDESARIDIRTLMHAGVTQVFNPLTAVTVVATAQSVNTNINANPTALQVPAVASSGLTVLATTLPGANANSNYAVPLSVAHSTVGAVTWSLTSGSVPPGLSIDPSTGLIAGVPLAQGSFSFTATTTSNANPNLNDSASFTITVGPPVTPTDTTPPSLVSLSFPATVDVTQGAKTLAVTIHATDNSSGVYTACFTFQTALGQTLAGCGVSTPPSRDATFNGSLNVPAAIAAGTWTLASVRVWDYYGNLQSLTTSQLTALGVSTTLTITSNPSQLTLTSFTVSPQSVNVSAGAASVSVNVGVTDSGSPVSAVWVYAYAPNFRSAAYAQGSLTSGTAANGVWQVNLTIPQGAPAGTWTVYYVYLNDQAGNFLYLTSTDLTNQNYANTFTVTSVTPQLSLTSLSISPSSVDVSAGSASVVMNVGASDNGSAVTEVFVYAYAPNLGSVVYNAGSLISGTPSNGVWQVNLTVPQGASAGTWTISYVYLVDQSGNYQLLTSTDLTAKSYPDTFNVTSGAPSISLTSVAISPQSLDVSAAPGSVSLNIGIADGLAAIHSVNALAYGPGSVSYASGTGSLVSGTTSNGVWQINLSIPQNASVGTWTIYYVEIIDGAGNARILYSTDIAPTFPDTFKVSNSTGPQTIGLSFPALVDTSAGPQTVNGTITTKDMAASLSNIFIVFNDPSGNSGPSVALTGPIAPGVTSFQFTLPQNSQPGIWKVYYVYLIDQAGSRQLLYASDLAALGLPTTFQVQ